MALVQSAFADLHDVDLREYEAELAEDGGPRRPCALIGVVARWRRLWRAARRPSNPKASASVALQIVLIVVSAMNAGPVFPHGHAPTMYAEAGRRRVRPRPPVRSRVFAKPLRRYFGCSLP
jgi:hypothetical protein